MEVPEIVVTRQTGKKLDARERARLDRIRVAQERAERDSNGNSAPAGNAQMKKV